MPIKRKIARRGSKYIKRVVKSAKSRKTIWKKAKSEDMGIARSMLVKSKRYKREAIIAGASVAGAAGGLMLARRARKRRRRSR